MTDSHFLTFALAASAAILWSAWLALCLREKGFSPIREVLDRFSRLDRMCKVGVLFLVVQMTMFDGAKHGGTNDVMNVDGTNVVTEFSGTNEVGEVEKRCPHRFKRMSSVDLS